MMNMEMRGIDEIKELPSSSRRQADTHRASAFRWVRFPIGIIKKIRPVEPDIFRKGKEMRGIDGIKVSLRSSPQRATLHRSVAFQ